MFEDHYHHFHLSVFKIVDPLERLGSKFSSASLGSQSYNQSFGWLRKLALIEVQNRLCPSLQDSFQHWTGQPDHLEIVLAGPQVKLAGENYLLKKSKCIFRSSGSGYGYAPLATVIALWNRPSQWFSQSRYWIHQVRPLLYGLRQRRTRTVRALHLDALSLV